MTGYFITFEGPDGSGKSSVLKEIVHKLQAHLSQEIILSREPGGSELAEVIRELILNPQYTQMDGRTEALLYAASRRQHIQDTILPSMAQGKIVISDRFLDSSLAYQGAGRELGFEQILAINDFATAGLRPDVTIYLDVEAEIGLDRIATHRHDQAPDRLEQEALDFHQRVQEGYREIIEREPDRFIVIDASQSLDLVIDQVWSKLYKRLKSKEEES